MTKLTPKTRVRIEISRGGNTLIARELDVRSPADLEVGLADTMRAQRLASQDTEPMWESAIKVTRLGFA